MKVTLNVYSDIELSVRFDKYQKGGTAIILEHVDGDIGFTEQYAIATVYVVELEQFSDEYVAIKNYAENEGVLNALIDGGVVEEEAVAIIRSGFVDLPIHKLTVRAIKKMKEEVIE